MAEATDRALPAEASPGPLARALAVLHRRSPVRGWSVIVSIFGDCVSPRGGTLWLGSLQEIAGALGLDAGLVRTALTRLAADGLIERTRVGRNSFVALSPAAEAETRRVAPQIYRFVERPWAGGWRLAMLAAAGEDAGPLRAKLAREGFAALAPAVMIAPVDDDGALYSGRRTDLGAAAVLEAQGPAAEAPTYAGGLWPIEDLAAAYRTFEADFFPVAEALSAGAPVTDLDALAIRVVLLHEIRRLALRDPLLPAELLPADWPGRSARALAGKLYGLVLPASEAWLDRHGRSLDGPLPPADARLARRFP